MEKTDTEDTRELHVEIKDLVDVELRSFPNAF